MRKLKHNKLKNTGLLFELLSRAMMHETLHPDTPQHAAKIIRRHFKTGSELLSELHLYQGLSNRTDYDVNDLLSLSLQSRHRIDETKLTREKYDLIRSIKKEYDIESFFGTRVSNYKLQASIYKIFEYSGDDNPIEYLSSKKLIVESLTGNITQEPVIDEVEQSWRREDSDTRKLGFKIIVERFNEKYRELGTRQKKLLSKYINEDPTSDGFRDYVIRECGFIGKKLNARLETVQDIVMRVKLEETINLMQNIISAKQIKEDHLSSMLKYYELIEVLENAQ